MSQTGILALVMLLCMALLCGINIYLVMTLLKGIRVDDESMSKVAATVDYLVTEVASIGRSVRRLSGQGGVGSAGSEAAGEGGGEALPGFQAFQENGFQEIAQGALDSQSVLSEFSQIKDRELASWKAANQARIDGLLKDHANMHQKLVGAQELLDAANQTIHTLNGKMGRLTGADAKAKALEGIRQGMENELRAVKTQMARLQAEANAARKEAEEAKSQLAEQDNRNRAMHQSYKDERDHLETERNALELRLKGLQDAFDQTFNNLAQDDPLKGNHEQYVAEREAMEGEVQRLENQLRDLQENFDRTLIEKAFIEQAFLAQDETTDDGAIQEL